MRVVSLACSNTEIVCALGCADRLVGVDDHSDRPAEVVARLPRVGPDLNVDVVAVTRLKPDLVLASLTVPGHEEVVAGLEAAGLPYLAPEPLTLNDVYQNIFEIAQALRVTERAETLVADMKKRLTSTPSAAPRPKILVQWWNRPTIAPGRLSWVDDLIRAAGGANVLTENVKSRPLSDEEVRALEPDALVISWCGIDPAKYRPDVLYRNPAWQDLRAVRAGHVYCVPEAYLGRPGPGLVEGFAALRAVVVKVDA